MLFVLEALKEAGARALIAMGQTMSIVGGLVLGDAAVSARFAAAPTVIVVAIAGVTGLMVHPNCRPLPCGFASCCSLLQPPGDCTALVLHSD